MTMNATDGTNETDGTGRILDLVDEPFHADVRELLKPDSVLVVYGPPASGKTLNGELFRTFFGREKLIDDGAVRGGRGYALPREGCVVLMQEERMRKLLRNANGRLVVQIPVEAAIEMAGGVVPVAAVGAGVKKVPGAVCSHCREAVSHSLSECPACQDLDTTRRLLLELRAKYAEDMQMMNERLEERTLGMLNRLQAKTLREGFVAVG